MKKLSIFLVFSALLLLPACVPILSLDMDIYLYANERWKITMELVVDQSVEQMAGLSTFQQQMEAERQKYSGRDINVSWKRSTRNNTAEVAYLLTYTGQGYENANEVLGETALQVDTNSPGRRITFQMNSLSMAALIIQNSNISLHGGRVIKSNGIESPKGTVVWTGFNGGMHAVMTESGSPALTVLWIFLVGFGGGLLFFVWRSQKQREENAHQSQAAAQSAMGGQQPNSKSFCMYCGAKLVDGAAFCMKCGKKVT